MVTRTWQDFDLLRRRRQFHGVEALQPVARPGQLWKSRLIGIGLFVVGLGGWLALFLYSKALQSQEQALRPVAEEHQRLQAQLAERSQSNEALVKANQSFADAILAIPSGALLLGDLAESIPVSVQLTQATLVGSQLLLNGVATQPHALRTINAFQLLLERSPLFQAQQVELIKLVASSPGQAQDAQGLTFEMKAALEPAATKKNLSRLQALGATGLRRRLAVLQEEGLLK